MILACVIVAGMIIILGTATVLMYWKLGWKDAVLPAAMLAAVVVGVILVGVAMMFPNVLPR